MSSKYLFKRLKQVNLLLAGDCPGEQAGRIRDRLQVQRHGQQLCQRELGIVIVVVVVVVIVVIVVVIVVSKSNDTKIDTGRWCRVTERQESGGSDDDVNDSSSGDDKATNRVSDGGHRKAGPAFFSKAAV